MLLAFFYRANAKATGGRNTVRKTSVTMPSGNVLSYGYNSASNALGDDTSRLSKITDGGVRLVDYDYLGSGQVVGTTHSEPDIMWELFGSTSGSFPDLDRFNRITSSRWTVDLATDVDFYDVDITYDRGSNVTLVEDNIHSGFDVEFTSDDLNRLTRAEEGTWSGSAIGTRTRDQQWTLDQTGNWDVGKLDINGDGDFTDAGEYNDDRSHNDVNEVTARDVDDDVTNDYTFVYDEVGNLTDDGESYKYEWDVFGRTRFVRNQSDALVAEYRYNGLGFLIAEHVDTDSDGDVDSNDKWYYKAYDERWRKLATFRESDTSPKEEYIYHDAGLDGSGTSNHVTGVICRDWDDNTAWTAASDGVLEKRAYLPQNWRADVVNVVQSTGLLIQSLRYSSYGVPIGLPSGDTDSDGDCDSTDTSQIQTWINASAYDVRGDLNLDGSVNATDKTIANTYFVGETLGFGSAFASTFNGSKGYGGYELTSLNQWIAQRRTLLSGLGIWARRDPLGFAGGYNSYQYEDGGPLRYTDSTGLKKCDSAFTVDNPSIDAEIPVESGQTNKQFIRVGQKFPDMVTGLPSTKTFSQIEGNACSVRSGTSANIDRLVPAGTALTAAQKCEDACYWHGKAIPVGVGGGVEKPCDGPEIGSDCIYDDDGWPLWVVPPQLDGFTSFFAVATLSNFTAYGDNPPSPIPFPASSSETRIFIFAKDVPCDGFEIKGHLIDPLGIPSQVTGQLRAYGRGGFTGVLQNSPFARSTYGVSCGTMQLTTSKTVGSQLRSKLFSQLPDTPTLKVKSAL